MLFHTILSLTLLSAALASFLNPKEGGDQSIWTIGDVQSIRFEAQFQHYTIALWQENLQAHTAKIGPIIYEASTEEGQTEGSFDWTVQLYSFDLQDSSTFFLWMFDGDSSAQGNPNLPGTSSPYFQIIVKPPPSPSSSTSSSSIPSAIPLTSTSSRATSTEMRAIVATTITSSEASMTSKIATAPRTITLTTPSTAGSTLPPETSNTDNTGASSTIPSASPTRGHHNPDSGGDGSTRVKAGIAIGVGVAILGSIVAGFILWYRCKTKRKEEPPVRPKISHPMGLLTLDPHKRSISFSRNDTESYEDLRKGIPRNQLAEQLPPIPAELDSREKFKPAEMV